MPSRVSGKDRLELRALDQARHLFIAWTHLETGCGVEHSRQKVDIADRYWRGKYNMAVGMAKGEVKSKGPVSKVLKLVPLTKPLFPVYLDLVKQKDAEA